MIYSSNHQNQILVDNDFEEKINEVVNFVLNEEEVNVDYQISIVFVDNEEIKKINEETRGIDKATDVLSFPMLDYPNKKVFKDAYKNYEFDITYLDDRELILGDIVLSLERAREQSEEFNHSYLRECAYLIVHSVLHLLGYDHMEEEDKKVMRKREEEILNKLKITRDL